MLAGLLAKKQGEAAAAAAKAVIDGKGKEAAASVTPVKKTAGLDFSFAMKMKIKAAKRDVWKLEDGWSQKKSCCDCRGLFKNTKLVQGLSYYRPILGQRAVVMGTSRGIHTWRLHLDGGEHISFGVAGGAAINWWRNAQFWGMGLWDRRMCFGGKLTRRERGPDAILVPCNAIVTVDCEDCTLSLEVSGVDLGIVCSLPHSGQSLSCAVATGREACSATLLSYEYEPKDDVKKTGPLVPPDEDIMLMDDLHKRNLLSC